MASGYSSVKLWRRVYSSLSTLYLIQQVLSLRSFSFKKLDYSLLRGIISEMVWTKAKKRHDPHPRFEPGSAPTLVINTAGASLLDPSALFRDNKSPSFCGLFYSQGNQSRWTEHLRTWWRRGTFNTPEATRSVSVWSVINQYDWNKKWS